MQALPHLRSTVVHLHAAVAIYQHQRARLIESRCRDRNSELYRRHRDSALAMRLLRVKRCHCLPPRRKITCALQFMPDPRDPRGVFYRLAIMGRLPLDIEVALTHYIRRQIEGSRDAIEYVFDHHHALRAPKSAKSRL